ncbi:MAG: MarR family winged helix-turn-helix transcriptional regulator [Frisingicoccus sp.]
MTYYYDKMFENIGITVNQYSLMANINSVGTTNITDLTRIVKLDKSTLTRTLAPLIDTGYIHSERGKNRREVVLSLTVEGKVKLEEISPVWQKIQEEMITF